MLVEKKFQSRSLLTTHDQSIGGLSSRRAERDKLLDVVRVILRYWPPHPRALVAELKRKATVPQFQQVKVKGRMLDYSLRNCPKPQSVRLKFLQQLRHKEKKGEGVIQDTCKSSEDRSQGRNSSTDHVRSNLSSEVSHSARNMSSNTIDGDSFMGT